MCDKSYFKIISVYYLEGQPPLLLAQNSPLKGSELNAESEVPDRERHDAPESREGESGNQPEPEIAAPVCDKSYFKIISVYYLEGQPPLLLAQNSPLKGSELNAESEAPERDRHAEPEIREGESGKQPAPENAAP